MTKKLTGPALVAYLRQFPTSDDRQWAADYIESLTDIISHQAKLNEAAHAEIESLLAERDALREALEEVAEVADRHNEFATYDAIRALIPKEST